MLPVRNTLRLPPPPLGPGIRAYLSFAKGGVGSAPATIINGVAALGCGAQYRRLLAVRRTTSIVPPCQPCLLPLPPLPSSLLFSFFPGSSPTPPHYFRGYRRATLCPSFFHLDAAGWKSARKRDWSTFSRVSGFFIPFPPPGSLPFFYAMRSQRKFSRVMWYE